MAASLEKVDASFISRTLLGASAINMLKGTVFGGAVAVSQGFALTFGELAVAAKAQHKAIDMAEFFAKSQGRLAVFVPAICAHTAFFAAYRGNGGDTAGLGGMVQPLLVTSLPTIAYSAYTRAAPPAFLGLSLVSCVLLHTYDRVWHPKGLHTENAPLARLNRRVF